MNIEHRPRFQRVVLLAILAGLLLAAGCGTSANFRNGVAESFPVVASRLEGYPLDAQQQAEVAELRAASAEAKAVTYDRSSAAWTAAGPDYRAFVGGDPALSEQRRADWITTANLVDELVAAEGEYRRSLGIFGRP